MYVLRARMRRTAAYSLLDRGSLILLFYRGRPALYDYETPLRDTNTSAWKVVAVRPYRNHIGQTHPKRFPEMSKAQESGLRSDFLYQQARRDACARPVHARLPYSPLHDRNMTPNTRNGQIGVASRTPV